MSLGEQISLEELEQPALLGRFVKMLKLLTFRNYSQRLNHFRIIDVGKLGIFCVDSRILV